MKNITTHKGTLKELKRLPSSINGNPRFEACVDQGNGDSFVFKTRVDAMHAYSIQNYEGKEVVIEIGDHYNTPQLNSIKCIDCLV